MLTVVLISIRGSTAYQCHFQVHLVRSDLNFKALESETMEEKKVIIMTSQNYKKYMSLLWDKKSKLWNEKLKLIHSSQKCHTFQLKPWHKSLMK